MNHPYLVLLLLNNGIFHIKKADSRKDQSYFLCKLNQDILKNVRFPLAKYSKEEVRELAQKAGLNVAEKKDSQEVCFIPDDDYISFIEKEKKRDAEWIKLKNLLKQKSRK